MSITVCLLISTLGIKLAASNFGSWAFWAWNLPFWGTLLPHKPKIRRIGARRQVLPIDASPLLTARSPSVEGTGVYRQYTDIRPSPEDGRICLFVILCVCTVTDFSAEDKAISASNFARRFVGILDRESPILGNVAPPEAQNSLQA